MNEQLENMRQSMMNIIDCYETQMQNLKSALDEQIEVSDTLREKIRIITQESDALKSALQEQIEVSDTLREKIRIITQESDALKLLVKSYKEFLEFRNRKDKE